MNIIKSEEFTLKTHLTVEEIKHRLLSKGYDETQNLFISDNLKIFKADPNPFQVTLKDNHFVIIHIVESRRLRPPIVEGSITEKDGASYIKIRIKINNDTNITFIVFSCITLLFIAYVTIENWVARYFNPMVFLPLSIILFSYIGFYIHFKYRAFSSKLYLENFFEGKILEW